MSRSRLIEVINKKIINTALLTSKFCAAPISSTCRFRYPEYQGSRMPCTAPLDTPTIQLVVDAVNGLHDFLGDLCVDSPGAFGSPTFRNALASIVQHTLCSTHRNASNVHVLLGEYLEAITKTATNELHTTSTLADGRRKTSVDQLFATIGKTPRMNAERAGYAQTAAGTGPSPFDFSGRGHTDDPFAMRGESFRAPPRPRKRRRSPDAFTPRTRPAPTAEVSSGAWEHSIERYTTAWASEQHHAEVMSNEATKSLKEILVFPCLTGKVKDVSEHSVLLFYDAVAKDRPASAIKFFREELLSWHPDRIDLKFTGARGKEEVKDLAAMIFRVANQALEQARNAAAVVA